MDPTPITASPAYPAVMPTPLDVRGAARRGASPVPDLVADLERALDRNPAPEYASAAAEALLHDLLRGPDFLAPEECEPDPTCYRTHILAVAPSRRFSVLALVWLPGQVTPIHDHICWCVVGVARGVEREDLFTLRAATPSPAPSDAQWLVPAGIEMMRLGDTARLVPPRENIHQVRNAGADLAISIHIYGADIARWGSSINQRFDDVPIRAADAQTGYAVPWRMVAECPPDAAP